MEDLNGVCVCVCTCTCVFASPPPQDLSRTICLLLQSKDWDIFFLLGEYFQTWHCEKRGRRVYVKCLKRIAFALLEGSSASALFLSLLSTCFPLYNSRNRFLPTPYSYDKKGRMFLSIGIFLGLGLNHLSSAHVMLLTIAWKTLTSRP